jgi:hypothetical protein
VTATTEAAEMAISAAIGSPAAITVVQFRGRPAELLGTELVANVVDHVGDEADLTLELSVSADWLRMAEVHRPPLGGRRPQGRHARLVRPAAAGGVTGWLVCRWAGSGTGSCDTVDDREGAAS